MSTSPSQPPSTPPPSRSPYCLVAQPPGVGVAGEVGVGVVTVNVKLVTEARISVDALLGVGTMLESVVFPGENTNETVVCSSFFGAKVRMASVDVPTYGLVTV